MKIKIVNSEINDNFILEGQLQNAKFYGKGGTTKIKKSQVDDFFKALGIIVED